MLCLTRKTGAAFIKCDQDPERVTRIVPAASAASIRMSDLAPGEWSLLVVHDENRNGRLDTAMMVPREGFGFSRNPALRMGPPRYKDVHFYLPAGESRQPVKIRYLF